MNKSVIKALDKHKGISLSDADIRRFMGGQCNIVVYGQIKGYNSIEQLLDPYGVCFILYEWKPHYGHWCVLIKSGNLLEFFDPYGGPVDTQLHHVPPSFKVESGQDRPYLGELMMNYDGPMSYNEFQFQSLDKAVKDCGRWCLVRADLRDLTLAQFKDLFLNIYGDELATFMTTSNRDLLPKKGRGRSPSGSYDSE